MTVAVSWVLAQLNSVQFRMVSMHSEKPIIMCSTPSLRSFLNVAFETAPVFVWLTVALSHLFNEALVHASLFQAINWCNVLGFVPASSVPSSTALQIFQDASHLWRLLCYLFCHFPSMGVKYQDSVNQPLQEQFLFLSFFLFCKGEREELGGGGSMDWDGGRRSRRKHLSHRVVRQDSKVVEPVCPVVRRQNGRQKYLPHRVDR